MPIAFSPDADLGGYVWFKRRLGEMGATLLDVLNTEWPFQSQLPL